MSEGSKASKEIASLSDFEILAELVEVALANSEPSFYPIPQFAQKRRYSSRQASVTGSAYGGVKLKEITTYQRDNPEVTSTLTLSAWELRDDKPAATDFGAWHEKTLWSVPIDETLDPETVEACIELMRGTIQSTDSRFERFAIEN